MNVVIGAVDGAVTDSALQCRMEFLAAREKLAETYQ